MESVDIFGRWSVEKDKKVQKILVGQTNLSSSVRGFKKGLVEADILFSFVKDFTRPNI